MAEYQMGAVETLFADLIWQKEPLTSSELVKLSEKVFQWKKSTTYTVLKRLCEKGIFQNEKGTVTSLISREDFYAMRSERFVEETFHGSLPAFLSAFMNHRGISAKEAEEIQRMIDVFKKEGEA